MGDTSDGSSSAAHGAQGSEHSNPGLIRRLFDAISPSEAAVPHSAPLTAANGTGAGSGLPGMLNLRKLRVEDVAIPRVEITAVPCDIDLPDLVEVFRDSGNTRLPVYDGTLDEPIGMVHLKDLSLHFGFNGNGAKDFELRQLLRPLLYAPPSMPIGVLLQKMQTDRSHMALVIDEYGGVDGLVTIEDLIEQVVGEIEDEHDVEEDALFVEEKPGCYLALARTPLDDFTEATGLQLRPDDGDEEVDTLGGLVFMEVGRVPARGEVVPHDSGAQFEVVDADPRRIKRLRVRMPGVSKTPVSSAPAPTASTSPILGASGSGGA